MSPLKYFFFAEQENSLKFKVGTLFSSLSRMNSRIQASGRKLLSHLFLKAVFFLLLNAVFCIKWRMMIPFLLPQANKGCHGKRAQEAEEISAKADVHVHQSSELKFSFIFCHFQVSSCTQQQSASYWHRLSNVIISHFSEAQFYPIPQ